MLIDQGLNAKIGDFGLSRLNDDDTGMTACGTPAWTAPEVVTGESYDEKVDVYSYGMVVWEMIALREPYGGLGGLEVVYAAVEGQRPKVPGYCPDQVKDLIVSCWSHHPSGKATAYHWTDKIPNPRS